ncbi:MAG: coproporphyrinogen dehydrogenase HemZ [Anaerovoracaceae bacterium]
MKIFLLPADFKIFTEEDQIIPESTINLKFNGNKNDLKREIYQTLAEKTGRYPKWGILTGIRPVKLTGELIRQMGSEALVCKRLSDYYLVHEEKIKLLIDIYHEQQKSLGTAPENSVGVYIGIPFCPTRCLYCSFTSNQVEAKEISRYLEALHKEINFVGKKMKANGLYPESIYIGGGTPTTLTRDEMSILLDWIIEDFDLSRIREITVEAGRPDTITLEKLQTLREHGVERISINPQSMKEETLKIIGRSHTAAEIEEAFLKAKKVKMPIVNGDLIAGLPGESLEDFRESLTRLIDLEAENITIHNLAVKRSSRLKDIDQNFNYKQADLVEAMIDESREILIRAGYRPYYLYKQKHTSGSTENIGYCKGNTLNIYNIRIMEERQTIVALGAGGITKVYFPLENRLERVPNVSNYEIYIERINEMLQRKQKDLFRR